MTSGSTGNIDTEEVLIYWIRERESIRLLKEGGKSKPYTSDEILRDYRFCNGSIKVLLTM